MAAQARFGERVPVPVTTFAPIATGGVAQQPITSFNYENIGVNIDITPRTHHDDDVSLALKVEVSSISGTGFGGLPTFGNRSVNDRHPAEGRRDEHAGRADSRRRAARRWTASPGLSDLPVRRPAVRAATAEERQETDIILTLTPHIVRVLDLTEDGPARLPRRPRRRLAVRRAAARSTPPPTREADQASSHTGLQRQQVLTVLPPCLPTCAPSARRLLQQVRVAALDGLERPEAALPVRRERGGGQRHPRPQVAGVERPAPQLRRAR